MKLASNVAAAQDAASGFAGVDPNATAEHVSLGSSNVSSMQDGAIVANKLMSCISDLISEVKDQASRVTALASEIEQRDKQDAQVLCEARWVASR